MTTRKMLAPGLTGDYLNAWLAALGTTVLVKGLTLRWTEDLVPLAVLRTADGADVVETIAAAFPSVEDIDRLAIANPGTSKRFPRNVDGNQYAAAAKEARASRDHSLAASVTDLVSERRDGKLPHSPFDPPAPRGETLWNRLRGCRCRIGRVEDAVNATLAGRATRVATNGLGFDYRRIPAGSQPGGPHVDPVLECLAFYGLAFFPTRGAGAAQSYTRGWDRPHNGGSRFCWPAWSTELDRWAIDALLGAAFASDPERWKRFGLGVTQVYEARRFKRTGDMDQTTGFASRLLP